MCDVAYSTGSTETVVPGNQIDAVHFPQEQMTYNWQPGSGALQMYVPTPSPDTTSPDLRVNGYTYPAGSFNLDFQVSTASINGTALAITPTQYVGLVASISSTTILAPDVKPKAKGAGEGEAKARGEGEGSAKS